MKEQITVDKAIKRGHLIVNLPVMLLMIGFPALFAYLFSLNIIPNWGIVVGFLIGFLSAWLYWSYKITKWRLWAFENVRNVHELKKRAIQEGLIWKDNKWYERTEIQSDSDKRKWKDLERKFEKKDEYKEDYSIPLKTTIYFSKSKNIYELIIMLLCFGFGIFLLSTSDSYIFGSILTLVGGYFSIKEFRQVINTKPQIIIDNKGIKTITTEFKNWSEIHDEDVIIEGSGKNREFYLVYDFLSGSEYLKIDDYNTNQKQLLNILRTYRIRSKNNYR
ncbi:MAG: hypothetical protein HWD85_04630 [Flavobacteriaceae bacterium]|nr:hypothetical protein [Flavobacteriaceae bacterium]